MLPGVHPFQANRLCGCNKAAAPWLRGSGLGEVLNYLVSSSSAAFRVLLGRITAQVLASSGR